ncbi:hypothetical protein F1880_002437 [Penicillium rolfsii]|nr:hypothetical protein F1880_002437 [Penicillium rolfsii]
MEDDMGEKKAPPGEEQSQNTTLLSLQSPKSSVPNFKVTENNPAKAEVDFAMSESTSPMNLEEPVTDKTSSCSDCKAGLESVPTMGLSTNPIKLREALTQDTSEWPELNDGLETDPTKCGSRDPQNITRTLAENGNARSGVNTESETVPEVSLGESFEEDQASVQEENLGPLGQEREGLQHVLGNLIAKEADDDPDESSESQANSSYEEDHHFQIPDWQNDDSDDMISDLDATMDESIPDRPDDAATAHDWQREDYITQDEWSGKA